MLILYSTCIHVMYYFNAKISRIVGLKMFFVFLYLPSQSLMICNSHCKEWASIKTQLKECNTVDSEIFV